MVDYEAKNTVSSKNQTSQYVYFNDEGGDGYPKVAFIGNSITLHGPKPDVLGWYGNWGMAASAKDKDYLHLIMAKIKEKHPDASYCILSGAVWERDYKNFDVTNYRAAKDYKPDIIICSISANIPKDQFEIPAFKDALKRLHTYLVDGRKNVHIFQCSSFFNNELKTQGIKEYTEENGVTFIYISDIVADRKNCAYDKFEHTGVGGHPGDLGMQIIADRYLAEIEKIL